MAGILANSVSATMTAGDTAVDNTRTGYLTGEQIALGTNPAGSAWEWSLGKPAGSSARCVLSDVDAAGPAFTPDVAGYYVITCTVDSVTTYVLRVSVSQVAASTALEALRFMPIVDASVVAPATGDAVFRSSAGGRLRAKASTGAVRELEPRFGTFTLAGGTATIVNATATATTVVAHHCTAAVARGHLTFTVTPGVGFAIASDNGGDGSTYLYALLG